MSRSAFITGASGGIGSAVALRLAKDGFGISLCYHSDDDGIKKLEDELREIGVPFKTYRVDVAVSDEVNDAVEDAIKTYDSIDVLVNCAGVALTRMLADTTDDEFTRLTDVNFRGVFNTCRAAVPEMVRKKHGKIINISSMWGVYGASCEAVYSATKAAVIGLTKALARELAPSNIQVNCIAPGAIDTKMNNNLSAEEKADFADEIPMGRFGTPDEIAGTVSFLAGNDSGYITAQVITADGGLT